MERKLGKFETLLGGLVLSWMAVNPANVLAQGEAHAATLPPSVKAVPTAMMPQTMPVVPETTEPWTRKAAYRASTNQIVLHYGEGIHKDINLDVKILVEDGYPAIAVPGGKPGEIELFIGRGKFGVYTQSDLDRGTVTGSASNFYDRKIGKPQNPTDNLFSLAQ